MDRKEFQEKIKERLIYLMQLKNISENQLAKKSNIGQSTLNGILNKGTSPRSDILHSICEGLEISLKDFFDFYPFDKHESDENLKDYVHALKKQIDDLEKKLK